MAYRQHDLRHPIPNMLETVDSVIGTVLNTVISVATTVLVHRQNHYTIGVSTDTTGESELDRPSLAEHDSAIAGPTREAAGLRETGPRGRCQVSVSSPVLRLLQDLNAGKPYGEQIKPFNFIVSCHVRGLGHPVGADPNHLMAPYEKDPRRWAKLPWNDQHTGQRYGVSTSGPHGTRAAARVKTYGDVLREYEHHAESKCADASGAVG
jgi:hypothetical protein